MTVKRSDNEDMKSNSNSTYFVNAATKIIKFSSDIETSS